MSFGSLQGMRSHSTMLVRGNTGTKIAQGRVGVRKELPYFENELWHKIFAATDLETCKANRIAFHDMLSRDWEAAWTFLFSDFEKDECRPLKPPQDWPMMILLLKEKKIPESFRIIICERLARYKSPSLLKEARQAGCPWNALVIYRAVCYGSLDCLRWARENGCRRYALDHIFAEIAASHGFLDVLKYLHQNDFCWDKDTMTNALCGGHLACLKFANENGCPWTCLLFKAAKTYQKFHRKSWTEHHWDCVKYLLDARYVHPKAEWPVPKKWWGSFLNTAWNAKHELISEKAWSLQCTSIDDVLLSLSMNGYVTPLTLSSVVYGLFSFLCQPRISGLYHHLWTQVELWQYGTPSIET